MNPLNHKWSRWPLYDPEEVGAVARVLESGCVNYWTGEEGHSFEQEFSSYCGVKHAIALANGTVALELALRALGVGAGDEVIVTARTFVASASAIVMVGATPVFADVDRESQNITRDTIREKITPKTRAVIAVHLAGHPCDMDPIMALA
ncbi:MAG: aminotransferase, partial [Gammaproteobacteria bacterium]|nr:aminotransferase [Gammaproteobacteria bacterium]